ncbi:MAG: hypothetical protein UY21_C0024G0008 [Microgenomates group bacterium GW2011_GWA1_48_10]|nr:MAG: hypothetical protein UY21_C0024G0008 [Microgenomates group bacterium GW2011_GWA1_48_10]
MDKPKKSAKPKKISKKLEQELIAKYGHVPTKEEIFAKIKTSQERMIEALKD